ncbi:MAG TPA: 30S ribosomal protein S1 [Spirochaetia bacterium]|nr:30S ribosomal protein S1 [Spirochaetia bacterium]
MNTIEEEKKTDTTHTEQTSLQEEYLKSVDDIEEGRLIEGQVIEISPEFVFIDVGYKSEGKIPVGEFPELPAIGDTVSVLLVAKEGRNGQVVVSKKRADDIMLMRKIGESYRERKPISATVTKSIKGGFEALIEGSVSAFVPMSKIDARKPTNEEEYIGMTAEFTVEQYHAGSKKSIVLSRRSLLEDEQSRKRDEFFAEREEGEIVEGTVKNITSFGAFVDLGGFDGLLHINDMSWGRVTRPKDFVKKGDQVRVVIKHIDHEHKKINLSLKDLSENPWHTFESRYQVGDVVEGTVLRLTDFGAFIELEAGIEGLVHVSELSWVKRVRHPKEVFSVGDTVQVKILGYDTGKEKVSLSYKGALGNPWDDLAERYPVGSRIKRTVKNLSNSGAFFEIEEGIDGFLHVDDISWTRKVKSPEEVLSPGDEVEVMIVNVNPEERKIRLGMKQLTDDPWKALEDVFQEGSIIEAEVVEIKDAGMTVKVQGAIEGFIRRANLFDPSAETLDDVLKKYKPGDIVKAVVEELNGKRKRLQLSLREYSKRIQSEEMGKYLHDEEDAQGGATLADFIKQKDDQQEE